MNNVLTTGVSRTTFLLSVLLVGMALWHVDAAAREGDRSSPYDPHEVALMPVYCKYTQSYRHEVAGGDNPQQIAYWDAVMGPSLNPNIPMFEHVHHYCNAIWETNQAVLLKTPPNQKAIWLRRSLDDFDYLLARAPDTFVLLPEILTKKGENLLRLGRVEQARATLERAMKLKRDYWPPYATLADYYREKGDYTAAREVLQKGLAAVPNEKALKRRLAELGNVKQKAQ